MGSKSPTIPVADLWQGKRITSSNLHKIVFELENPEQAVRTLPAQVLYMAAKHQGLGSSSDLLALASNAQIQALLDFDLWKRDELDEETLWDWLETTDAEGDLSILQKILKSLDLKIVALLIARYVRVHIPDNKDDAPPGPGYYSPDQGQSWLFIDLEPADKHFLLGRLLALIFETSRELYYQLIAIPNVQTASTLEEEAYQDRCKRLASEGVPETQIAATINSPLSNTEFQQLLGATPSYQNKSIAIENLVSTLIPKMDELHPLDQLFTALGYTDSITEEVTLIVNAAIVNFGIDFSQQVLVEEISRQVRGALNIGLEKGLELSRLSAKEIVEQIGFQPLYRLGLAALYNLRLLAGKKVAALGEKVSLLDAQVFSMLANCREPFPKLPAFFRVNQDPILVDGKLQGGAREFRYLNEVKAVNEILTNISPELVSK